MNAIVMITHMGHLDFELLERGLFARFIDRRNYEVLAIPESVTQHPRFKEWRWDFPFPYDAESQGPNSHGALFLSPDDDIAAAVAAYAALIDTRPVIVPDGWMCS